MRMYDLIVRKRNGHELSDSEIKFLIAGVVDGSIPDYQLSAFLMAVYFKGMNRDETLKLTMAIARSGDMIDLSQLSGVKVDKHSTGGVGDKTTLIIAPIVASCGVKVAKMSGRGLGHTGGTVDKLEAIPGFKTELAREEFLKTVESVGCCVIGQSGDLAPADKKLYALRDVTGTVENISLIAASIMSKKLAAGADCILLDVKVGTGAFMKTPEAAHELAEIMVEIGTNAGKNTAALITDMNRPLGYAIGNSLEVAESIEVLSGRGPEDLRTMCIQLAGNMLCQAGKGNLEDCVAQAEDAIASGCALDKFKQMITAQGGDWDAFKKVQASVVHEVCSRESGYLRAMDTEKCGLASVILGAGRETKDSPVDHSAGILLKKKPGDYVQKGDILAELYANSQDCISDAEGILISSVELGSEKPANIPLIYGRVAGA